MADDWKTGYKRALKSYILRVGTPVNLSENSYYYGYIAQDWKEQRKVVREALESGALGLSDVEVEEHSWTTFGGTFASDDLRKHGVRATFEIAGVKYEFLVEESIGEILLGILNEE